MKEQKCKIASYIKADTAALLEKHYKEQGYTNMSDFVDDAIQFYCGYLSANDYSAYLPNIVISTMKGTLGSMERRMANLLFKVAVELVRNTDSEETVAEVSVAEQLAEKLEKETTAEDESSQESRWQFANRNRSNPYLTMTCARLVANVAQIIQEDVEKEQKQLNLIDKKLRRKIAEKKQLHGQRMG